MKNIINKSYIYILAYFLFTSSVTLANDPIAGATIFKANCTACHSIESKVIGPALKDADKRHSEQWLISWINDSQKLIKSGDTTAIRLFNENNQIQMTAFPELSKADIQNVIAYIKDESLKIDQKQLEPAVQPESQVNKNENNNTILIGLFGLIIFLLVIVFTLSKIISRINTMLIEKHPELQEEDKDSKFLSLLKEIFSNKKVAIPSILIIVFSAIIYLWITLWNVGINQNYQPEQPIKFSHKVHAGTNKIDCQYCHSGALKSKSAGIPTGNTCMNCHSQISEYKGEPIFAADGSMIDGTAEIQKLYDYMDFNPKTKTYGNNARPIEWVRIHTLQDFVYFNHSQHVKVAEDAIRKEKGLKADEPVCFACHGDVANMDEVFQQNPLTMKWCIDCHRKAVMTHAEDNPYYDEILNFHERLKSGEQITVAEIGGIECSKCHY